jgi:hypothetical protein
VVQAVTGVERRAARDEQLDRLTPRHRGREVQRRDAVERPARRIGAAVEQCRAGPGAAEVGGERERLGEDVGRVV